MNDSNSGEVNQMQMAQNQVDDTRLQSLTEIKTQIVQISQLPLETHSEEFEAIHNGLSRVLSSIDGI